MTSNQITVKRYTTITLGSFLFCLGLNSFIVPANLYNGGTVGIAQIIRTLLINYTSFSFLNSFDISGILNFILNIPLFVLAYKKISKVFFVRTVFSVVTQTIFFSCLPIPSIPIVDDTLTACLVGGLISGIGVGITLRAAASGGGADVLGVYFTNTKENFSVGKLTLYFNGCIYLICTLLFDVRTGIYSIIYSIIYTITIDKVHHQNINMNVMIFTKVNNIHEKIIFDLKRGVTYWNGFGGYTNDDTHILVSVVSKYEMDALKEAVLNVDPYAFIIFNEGSQVIGNYEKRL